MTRTKKDNTEEKILKAAQDVFVKKGMDGARMQEIADEAGINKALLHYYFRTKERLFHAIFKKVLSKIMPNVQIMVNAKAPIDEKLGAFIEKYIDLLLKNPFLPAFILREINRDPEFLASLFMSSGLEYAPIFGMFQKEMDAGNIIQMEPRELLINILSMCIFPIATKSLITIMLFENNQKTYDTFMQKRKESVKKFVLNAILTK